MNARIGWMLAAAILSGCWDRGPAAWRADGGMDAGGDADTDTDTDTDTGTDTSTATDTGWSCDEIPTWCCDESCPCQDGVECVPTHWYPEDGLGACHSPVADPDCWWQGDCGEYEACIGAFVCGCFGDCDWEGPGVCMSASFGCCGDAGACPDGYECMATPPEDTCHAILEPPACWSDGDCPAGESCVGEQVCSCMANCASKPGVCSGWFA